MKPEDEKIAAVYARFQEQFFEPMDPASLTEFGEALKRLPRAPETPVLFNPYSALFSDPYGEHLKRWPYEKRVEALIATLPEEERAEFSESWHECKGQFTFSELKEMVESLPNLLTETEDSTSNSPPAAKGGRPPTSLPIWDGVKVRALRKSGKANASEFRLWYKISESTLLRLERDGRATERTIEKKICPALSKLLGRKVVPSELKKNIRQ